MSTPAGTAGQPRAVPPYRRPGLVALVAVGGMVGSAGRYGLALLLPPRDGWPVATFLVNVVGSFVLGLLLEALVRHGPEGRRELRLRLGLGTGVLGGFTTFSSLALETERLLADGALVTASTYVLATLVCGLAACIAGVLLSARRAGERLPRLPSDPDALGPATPPGTTPGGDA